MRRESGVDWHEVVRVHLTSAARRTVAQDVVDEWAAHLERTYLAALGRGVTEREARLEAEQELIGAHPIPARATSGQPRARRRWWGSVWQDLNYGLRALRARPGFTAAALITLALGIGANSAIFTIVHAVLIRELPYREPNRLVYVYETFRDSFDRGSVNPFTFDAWQRETTAFSHLAPIRWTAATLTGAGDAERVQTIGVSATFFDALGVPADVGRVFTEDEVEAGRRVVVVSQEEWRTRFGADPTLVGRSVMLDDEPWEVVGVMPAGFRLPASAQYWRPYHLSAQARQNRSAWFLTVVGRLAPGVTLAEAQQQLDVVSARLAEEFPRQRKERGARVFDMHEDLTARVDEGLELLQGVAVVVLLIACANLANLQMAQASARLREFAVRAAVGAHRMRLVRQLLTENILLAGLGGAAGVLLALLGVPALVALAPPQMQPLFVDVSVSGVTLAFTAGLAMITGVVFGVVPALLFSRPNLVDALRIDGANATGSGWRSYRWLRSGLIAGEVALAFVLCAGAALLVRSFIGVTSQDPGFRTERMLTATVSLPARYTHPETILTFWSSVRARLLASPGVASVMVSNALPFSNWEWQTDFQLEAQPDLEHTGAGVRYVSAGYFVDLGLSLTSGREFLDSDRQGADGVILVNQAFVDRYVQGPSPVGQRIRLDRRSGEWFTIVGVSADGHHAALTERAGPQIYRPFAQAPQQLFVLGIRTVGPPEGAEVLLREVVREVDAGVPLQSVRSMDALVGRTVAERRFHTWLLALFAGLAGTLALVGIYGVTAYVVSLRRREVGIRIALGASPRQVGSLILMTGMRPVMAGLGAGLAVAWIAVRLIENQLFGVDAHDPVTFAAAALAFLAVSAMASITPARRGVRVNPLTVLKL